MNTNILRKILGALNAEGATDVSYIRGMVETLIEMQGDTLVTGGNTMMMSDVKTRAAQTLPGVLTTDEGALLDAQAKAAIDRVKVLSLEH